MTNSNLRRGGPLCWRDCAGEQRKGVPCHGRRPGTFDAISAISQAVSDGSCGLRGFSTKPGHRVPLSGAQRATLGSEYDTRRVGGVAHGMRWVLAGRRCRDVPRRQQQPTGPNCNRRGPHVVRRTTRAPYGNGLAR